jgi:hypothetical protein
LILGSGYDGVPAGGPGGRAPLVLIFRRRRDRVFFGVMCIVEIRPGRGGRDAEEFAGSIARAISAWSVRHNQPAGMSGSGTRSITVTLPRTPVTALR